MTATKMVGDGMIVRDMARNLHTGMKAYAKTDVIGEMPMDKEYNLRAAVVGALPLAADPKLGPGVHEIGRIKPGVRILGEAKDGSQAECLHHSGRAAKLSLSC